MKEMPPITAKVRVTAKKPSRKWTQGGVVDGISMAALMVHVAYPDGSSEWACLERVELQEEPSMTERAEEVRRRFDTHAGRRMLR